MNSSGDGHSLLQWHEGKDGDANDDDDDDDMLLLLLLLLLLLMMMIMMTEIGIVCGDKRMGMMMLVMMMMMRRRRTMTTTTPIHNSAVTWNINYVFNTLKRRFPVISISRFEFLPMWKWFGAHFDAHMKKVVCISICVLFVSDKQILYFYSRGDIPIIADSRPV